MEIFVVHCKIKTKAWGARMWGGGIVDYNVASSLLEIAISWNGHFESFLNRGN